MNIKIVMMCILIESSLIVTFFLVLVSALLYNNDLLGGVKLWIKELKEMILVKCFCILYV